MFHSSKLHVNNESMLLFPKRKGKHTYLKMHLDFCLVFLKTKHILKHYLSLRWTKCPLK